MTLGDTATATSGYAKSYIGDPLPLPNAFEHSCPQCGYCPHCGRGGYPYRYPYRWPNPWPWNGPVWVSNAS